jgi:hypothetical protein
MLASTELIDLLRQRGWIIKARPTGNIVIWNDHISRVEVVCSKSTWSILWAASTAEFGATIVLDDSLETAQCLDELRANIHTSQSPNSFWAIVDHRLPCLCGQPEFLKLTPDES